MQQYNLMTILSLKLLAKKQSVVVKQHFQNDFGNGHRKVYWCLAAYLLKKNFQNHSDVYMLMGNIQDNYICKLGDLLVILWTNQMIGMLNKKQWL